jgi:hypothetical protein
MQCASSTARAGDVPRLQVFLPVVEHEALGRDVEQTPFVAVQSGRRERDSAALRVELR